MDATKPNFFIVGAAKSGTTSLYHYLTAHPQIWMPLLKEPHYFGEYRPDGTEVIDQQTYQDLFRDGANFPAVGEASTAYVYSNTAAEEIVSFNPAAKIIIVLRNPVDRAYSLYWHNIKSGAEHLSFEEALSAESTRIREGYSYGFHYTRSGMYADQVWRFQQVFPPCQLRVILFEDLAESTPSIVRSVFEFLNVDQTFDVDTSKVFNRSGPPRVGFLNSFLHSKSGLKRTLLAGLPSSFKNRWKSKLLSLNSASPPAMQAETHADLRRLFEKDIQRLAVLIDRDLGKWLDPAR